MEATEFRNVGHQVVDLLADYLASVDQKRITPDINPERVRALFDEPLPQHGVAAEDILKELQQKLLPNCVHVSHPGYRDQDVASYRHALIEWDDLPKAQKIADRIGNRGPRALPRT